MKNYKVFLTGVLAGMLTLGMMVTGCSNPSSSDGGGGTSDTSAPAELGGLNAAAGDKQIVLTWTDPADSDFAKAVITYGTESLTVAKGTQTAVITGLTNGTAYTFTVKAVDTAGNSSAGISKTATSYVLAATPSPDIKTKFSVPTVDGAFTALHTLINDTGADFASIIALGDYIDLPELTIGGTTISDAAISGGADRGRLLRLMVVGINSFTGKNSNNTPHVVFQFRNLPVTHNMEATNINTNGYAGSAMQAYIMGDFLTALKAATGLTDTMLWAPTRMVSKGNSPDPGPEPVTDTLWLPTVWEMFGNNASASSAASETNANQARLEYYADAASRLKYDSSGFPAWYWTASPSNGSAEGFCYVKDDGIAGTTYASQVGGCAPAFCIQ
ncbi:hypothetical protein FACS1894137_13140 [Spirochaetia bacterium]|nr:hypothetical protein FACS1894137_13140 [Spirochaetia bacterium]